MPDLPFNYDLPPELIAQQPCEPRDHARLLVASRKEKSLRHLHFFDLPELLEPGDLLVLNDTRVVPARLLGKRARTGGKWEGLFLRELADGTWELLCQTRGTLNEGEEIEIDVSPPRQRGNEETPSLARRATLGLIARLPDGRWQAKPLVPGSTLELLERFGHVPLPPYIQRASPVTATAGSDRERYQTIFAREPGAVAAPTAGLHFTQATFDALTARSITWTSVTLHVGLATFQPIKADDYTQHPMHTEWCQLTQTAADAINACKGRVVAVGTTSGRVLESAALSEPEASAKVPRRPLAHASGSGLRPWTGETNLFIHPPYDFKVVDALVTNFHLPRTTLLLLVSAFAGVDLMRRAYEAAIAERYRFYSYGDAMLIV